ncbi:sensor histidine kinase [Paenibacillus hodogayensis]|uniref:histidine kinase n=1 Tax=Paenibacillus hodogayensis TaxID=279208 RepID=A0ABV5VQP3_9BACL
MQSNMPTFPNRSGLLYTLRSRVIVVLLLNSLVPLILIGGISYFSFVSILEHKIQNSIQNNLKKATFSLENELNSLNHVSMQLSFEQGIGKDLEQYQSYMDVYDKYNLELAIQNYIDLITYTNPNLGLTYYYFSDNKQTAFKKKKIRPEFNPDKLPILTSFSGIRYNGLHKTMDPSSNSLVLSVDRRIFLPGYDNLHVYVETNLQLADGILSGDPSGMNAAHVMVDDQNRIVYSENDRDFSIGSTFSSLDKPFLENQNSYIFTETTEQGWKMAIIIPKADYNREINAWFGQYAFIVVLSLTVALILAWVLWRTVYRPLSGINKEIRSLENSDFHSPLKYPRIAEFDYLLDRFQHMRGRIWDLLVEKERNEKMKAQLEVEKLLFQINPHFLHNTLDTIRWLARLNGQDEIDRLISTLNKLLNYNMGKEGTATIRQEINALRDYVALQQARYDFQFDVHIQTDDELMEVEIPRFILQPLVENALYHGIGDDGRIEVKVASDSSRRIIIEVHDNGVGMQEEEIRQLFDAGLTERGKVGMGIGIQYVSRIINVQYDGKARLAICSEPGKGTSMVLYIPLQEKTADAENTYCG